MLRSMYSGISGLRNFQTKLDVIGNNISNVNTYGFKKGRVIFKDLISQTVAGASAASDSRGGVNPKQVGLGSQISTIDTIHAGGSTQFTGNTLDLAISGDGFFQVADATTDIEAVDGDEFTSSPLYTRAGNFYMDNRGYLVNSDGKYLVGYSAADLEGLDPEDVDPDVMPDPQPIVIPTTAQSMSIGQDGTITFVNAAGDLKWAGQLILAKFPNPGGLNKVGGNYFQESTNSGVPVPGVATTTGIGEIVSGFLEMSNVDLAEEFTEMIVAQRGFQANTRIITTSDEILQELVNLKR
ncbi:flagellar basal body rod protein FlgG [Sporosarcina sp. ACRSL]|uniref:flagellar basal body rod protein FlgG n=1 Tax=Sporosarcina sp. ACRSL TaxID=2918215 RepID=UPI001EF4DBF6|nr:flagellar basal body rod protein FlgG [Sporosarcina sp. ACRSL]MCG7342874.1 flagellar basal body rod protein FlgG [Sporosarcina sp. ACRSL]